MATATLIKQRTLIDIVEKRQEIRDLKAALKQAEEDADKLALVVIAQVEKGIQTERGTFAAAINVVDGQRRPAWKEHVARLAGPAEVERITQSTEPGPPTKKLVLTESGRVVG